MSLGIGHQVQVLALPFIILWLWEIHMMSVSLVSLSIKLRPVTVLS